MAIKDNMISYLSQEDLQKMVKSLAREIEEDFRGEDVVLICPLKGSVFFISDLMKELKLRQQLDFVYVTNRSAETGTRGGDIKFIKDISMDISNKNVLIVEEIIDTGRTLSFLKNRLLAAGPKKLRIVCLLDKPARRVISIKPDYIGKTIDDRYVVGYGMDEDEKGRNYPEIYNLKN